MSTKSGRKQIIGKIDNNSPKVHTRKLFNVDTKRCLRTNDIAGAQPFYKRKEKVYFNNISPVKTENNDNNSVKSVHKIMNLNRSSKIYFKLIL